jgi:hypothetical protein
MKANEIGDQRRAPVSPPNFSPLLHAQKEAKHRQFSARKTQILVSQMALTGCCVFINAVAAGVQ